MVKRSPIRGYNHNVSYRGLVFHVQTEDSGVDNPHVFTHLFHAGVIISTRKLEYDADSAEESVKSLMQAQHKAALKMLTRGTFDDKIDQYLAHIPELLPRDSESAEELAASAQPGLPPDAVITGRGDRFRPSTLSPELLEQLEPPEPDAGESSRPARAAQATIMGVAVEHVLPAPQSEPDLPTVHFRSSASADDDAEILSDDDVAEIHSPPPVPSGARQDGTYRLTNRPGSKPPPVPPRGRPRPVTPRRNPAAGDVIVSRPSVIVGSGNDAAGSPSRPAKPPRVSRRDDTIDGLFGGDLISEKSLDEVILAYLSEDTDED